MVNHMIKVCMKHELMHMNFQFVYLIAFDVEWLGKVKSSWVFSWLYYIDEWCYEQSLLETHRGNHTGWPKKNNTETNQNDTDTNYIFGTNFILCNDIEQIIIKSNNCWYIK